MTTTQSALLSITSAFSTNHKNEEESKEEEEEDGLSITTILTPQLIIALIAFILNVGVIIKFWKVKKKVILEYVLFSLAFADALYCFFSLIGVLLLYLEDQHELEGEKIASFTNQLIWFSIYASIFHVLTISFDQFAAVMFLHWYQVYMRPPPIKRILALLWVMTGVLQGAIAIYQYKDGIENGHELDLKVQKITGGIIFATNILLSLTYGVIIYKLLLREHSRSKGTNSNMPACVVTFADAVGFVAFTFPIALFPYITVDNGEEVYLVVLCLLLCNSIFNPIVYYSRGHIIECLKSKSTSDGRDGVETKLADSTALSTFSGTNNPYL